METLYIALGRTGDVLAALPIIAHLKGTVMISREFTDVLDGMSLNRIVWERGWTQVRAAHQSVRDHWDKVVVLQQHSTDGWPQYHVTDSFVKEMYRLAGVLPHFSMLPLTFDRRDGEREMALLETLPPERPFVLLATRGFSSPFAHGPALRDLLERTFPDVRIVDMDTIRAERIYDLLVLFERAAALVTVDSALLHLAQATPSLPVIALIADYPTKWHGSPAYAGQRLRIPYHDFEVSQDRIVAALGACLEPLPSVGRGQPTPQDRR